MRLITFAIRNTKEILRDPISLGFGLGFPLVLLFLLSALQANIPVSLFEIDTLAPGITVFGLSFMTLFSATLIAKDRESAFLQRLYATPLRSSDFILGYMLPILPIAVGQSIICYLFAIPLGLVVCLGSMSKWAPLAFLGRKESVMGRIGRSKVTAYLKTAFFRGRISG